MPQHPSKWRGRLWTGLAGLVLLSLLALGLLFGYGAWLNAQSPPFAVEPNEPAKNGNDAKNQTVAKHEPEAQKESPSRPPEPDTPSSPTLTLAQLQTTASEPAVKALIDDLIAMPSEIFQRRFTAASGPLDEHWVTLLDRHQATIERLKVIARQDLWRVIRQPDGPSPEHLIFGYLLPRILAAQGFSALQQGDVAKALEVMQPLFHLACPPSMNFGWGASVLLSQDMLKYWIETGPPDGEKRRILLKWLESNQSNLPGWLCLAENIHRYCQNQRRDMLERYNKPWNSRTYHWDLEQNLAYFQCEIAGFYLPRPDHYIIQAFASMIEKTHAQKYMADCDAYYKEWEKQAAGLDYPALQAIKKPQPPRAGDYGIYHNEDQEKELLRNMSGLLAFGTECNLNRAALAWLGDPHSRPADGTVDFHKEPTHPWRDPFTEQPFHVDQTATATLIYSLGPDLADQHGQLAYDPTNGAASAGDIVLHIGVSHAK